jgi:ethanolamine transporter EutH
MKRSKTGIFRQHIMIIPSFVRTAGVQSLIPCLPTALLTVTPTLWSDFGSRMSSLIGVIWLSCSVSGFSAAADAGAGARGFLYSAFCVGAWSVWQPLHGRTEGTTIVIGSQTLTMSVLAKVVRR